MIKRSMFQFGPVQYVRCGCIRVFRVARLKICSIGFRFAFSFSG